MVRCSPEQHEAWKLAAKPGSLERWVRDRLDAALEQPLGLEPPVAAPVAVVEQGGMAQAASRPVEPLAPRPRQRDYQPITKQMTAGKSARVAGQEPLLAGSEGFAKRNAQVASRLCSHGLVSCRICQTGRWRPR